MKGKLTILTVILILDVCLACFCTAAVRTVWRNGRQTEEAGPGDGKRNGKRESKAASAEPEEKLLALTFDDGPHPVYTRKLLDGLRERHVKASFFLVGENIPGNEELVKQMVEDGHLVGTHCYSHEDLTKKTTEEARADIAKTNEMIQAIAGRIPEHIRPPYGIWSQELEENVKMTPVFWDIDTLDWKSQNSRKVESQIYKNVGKHQVILMHDVFGTSVDAALAAIDTLTQQGYTFVTVDELLID